MRAPAARLAAMAWVRRLGRGSQWKREENMVTPDCSGARGGGYTAHDMLDSMPNENPFQDPLRFERQVPECVIVIFGANGDLTKRKLLPALYRLAFDRRLSAGFAIVGISRTPLSDDDFREKMRASVEQFSEDTKLDPDVWAAFARGLYYVSGEIGDAGLYQRLGEKLGQIESQRHTGGNVLFYLSTQPSQY